MLRDAAKSQLVESTQGLLAHWDFQSAPGSPFVSRGPHAYPLHEVGGDVERVNEGVFGAQAIRLGSAGWLCAPRMSCPALNISGPDAQVSIMAWLKRSPAPTPGCQAVAGFWNEHGKRQYAMFLNLHIWDSNEQAAAHISATGGATSGYKYCMEAAIGNTPLPLDQWLCVAITFDGREASVFLNGQLDRRPGRNPIALPGGIFHGGEHGADFTVGAVARPEWVDDQLREHGSVVANRFHGLLGGLAVFGRALGPDEVHRLSELRTPIQA